MRFDTLDDDNYLFFAIKNYNNPTSVTKDDFFDDMNRFKYLKRLLKKYHQSGELKTHLIVNHLTIIFNIFGEAAVPLLLYKIDYTLFPVLKTFLLFLNRLPQGVLNNVPIDSYADAELSQL